MSEVMEIKEGYKETPLGLIPDDWNFGELGDVSEVKMGQSPPSSSYNQERIGIPLIQGNADIKKRLTVPRIWTSEPTKLCQKNEIILTVRAPVGAVAISTTIGCIGRGVCTIKPIEESNSGYVYQYLISLESKWTNLEQGSTFTAVNGSDIRSLKIPLPPLPEQKKIAEILTTVDDKIALIDERIEQTQALKKGLMQRLLTKGIGHSAYKDSPLGEIPESWEVVRFGQVISKHGYGPRFNANDYDPHGNVKTIRGTDINSNGDIVYDQVPTAILDKDLIENHKLKNKDLVMITTADCGLTGVFKTQNIDFIPSAYAVRISLKKEVADSEYFKYLLQTKDTSNQVNKFIRKGTVANLPASDILKFTFKLPTLREQNQIAEILTTIDNKIEVLQEKKSTYQALKKGLMQQLLTGKMRVKI